MYMQIEQDRYWVVQPSEEEVAALEDIPRRKKFADRAPFWLLGLAMALALLMGALVFIVYGASGGPWWITVMHLGLPFMVGVSALVFVPTYDYRAPLKHLVAAGRAFDLETGFGWSFVNRVLFVGDRHLDGHRQREVLQHADPGLIDEFWQNKLNHELLRRYENCMYELAKQLLLEALQRQARLIIEDIEQYVEPFRAAQTAEDAEEALHEDNAEQTELTGTRRFLLEEGLLPNG